MLNHLDINVQIVILLWSLKCGYQTLVTKSDTGGQDILEFKHQGTETVTFSKHLSLISYEFQELLQGSNRKSFLTGNITCCSTKNRKALQQVIKAAQNITGT